MSVFPIRRWFQFDGGDLRWGDEWQATLPAHLELKMPNKSPLPTGMSFVVSHPPLPLRPGGRARRSAEIMTTIFHLLAAILLIASCRDRTPKIEVHKRENIRETLKQEIIIGEYIVDSGAKSNFECDFDSDVMIGFRPTVLKHIKNVKAGEYGGISVTRPSDGWSFAGYDETSALVSPTKSGRSKFQIFNESGDMLKIVIFTTRPN